MKHRKWARFLGLTAASAASLCLGAFLSYQAATQAESYGAPSSEAAADAASVAAALAALPTPAAPTASAAPIKSADAAKSAELPAPPRPMVLASLESDAPPIFSPSNALASPLELRMEEEQQQDLDAALHDNDLATPANPQPLTDAAPLPADAPALFHGKPAPLPPVRPAALKVAPAELVAALPEPPIPPAAGPEPVIGPSPSAAPSLAPVVRAAPPAPAMAANSQGSFPSVANALAAVTASVGGASAAVTPMQPPAAAVPDGAEIGGFRKGSPVYVRIFKKEGVLELWLKRGDNYALYKSFPVCKWSGQLGPKTRQADYQSPEGFYSVSARQLNPNSHYHLAFDIGYPNAYDRRQGSTGNSVMVHGDCKSVGCFAMTNNGIDEIYGIVEAALRNGQREVPVHIFPFRMTEEAIARENSPKQFTALAFLAPSNPQPQRDWSSFWHNLKQGYDMFERSHVPPVAFACGDRYEFGAAAGSCARIAGW